jgi:hypothetical protein
MDLEKLFAILRRYFESLNLQKMITAPKSLQGVNVCGRRLVSQNKKKKDVEKS